MIQIVLNVWNNGNKKIYVGMLCTYVIIYTGKIDIKYSEISFDNVYARVTVLLSERTEWKVWTIRVGNDRNLRVKNGNL